MGDNHNSIVLSNVYSLSGIRELHIKNVLALNGMPYGVQQRQMQLETILMVNGAIVTLRYVKQPQQLHTKNILPSKILRSVFPHLFTRELNIIVALVLNGITFGVLQRQLNLENI